MTESQMENRKNCLCGSGKPTKALHDARDIFVAYVCDACEQRVKSRYRPEIFTDPNYWTDEPIDEDDEEGFNFSPDILGIPTPNGSTIGVDLANLRERLSES